MQGYLDKLENKIGKGKVGKILFNKYYNIKDLFWMGFYVAAFGILAGVGNAYPEWNKSLSITLNAFWQGFLNNTYLSVFVNLFFARTINFLSTKRYFRLQGNILNSFIQLAFLTWHFIAGTQNPMQTMILPMILSVILVNYHINSIKNNSKI